MVSTPRLPHSPQPPMALTEGGVEEARNVLLSFDQLPKWHQDNEFILHGYRSISGSSWISFRSWCYIHNETVNIYSHLIPIIIFLLSEWYLLQYLKTQYSSITSIDVFIFGFFIITVVICLGLSTIYHTLMNHSSNIEQLWLQFDLVGIVVLILGLFISGIYMVFWCEPLERKLYWLMIGILGSFTIFIMLSSYFQGQEFRILRTLVFIGTGLSGFAPLIHGIKMFGWLQMIKQSGMFYYFIEGGFLLLGTLIYITKFPEKQFPGRFDIYGSSHQLFHILVVSATAFHLIGILDAFNYNYIHRTCSSH
ncbi:hypothetical protein MKX08_006550 [Trichoderma sp. CBMAI-0020]|nr:hypothetical protein MKX08_006550 [Trichoderma sp. CBMAI-0020]WOD46105.1 hypothetical protein [Trichoderma atroviride]